MAVDPAAPGATSSCTALLLAAGSGDRLGLDAPKAFVPLGEVTILERSLVVIASMPSIDSVVVVVPADRCEEAGRLADRVEPRPAVRAVVAGGATRQESVERGLAAVPESAALVVCHDAARPFASPDLFARVVAALGEGRDADGAVPFVPSVDTVKRVRDGVVVETISRHEIGLAQTPQAFVAHVLREAHRRAAAAGLDATDDAMLLEEAGFRVVAVEGEATNFKITTAEDLRRARRLAARFPLA